MMGTWDNGNFRMGGADLLKETAKTLKPSDSKTVKSNYRINIKGNIALTDFDQVTTAADGSIGNQHNLYILEKINGEWKVQGATVFKTPGK